jgi:hypothetical protein
LAASQKGYGLALLSSIPLRENPDPQAPIRSQILFGEHFEIKEHRKFWVRVKLADDGEGGWIYRPQYHELSEEEYTQCGTGKRQYSGQLVAHVVCERNRLIPVLLGSRIDHLNPFQKEFEGEQLLPSQGKPALIDMALLYLNAPEQAGGKSPFGIDAAGLTQMVYKLCGHSLPRQVQDQAKLGEALSFVEESEAGDLAFFDNKEGEINHVGIILPNNYLIHVHGHVRIDRLDHTGIFNPDQRLYTHSLRVIKKTV